MTVPWVNERRRLAILADWRRGDSRETICAAHYIGIGPLRRMLHAAMASGEIEPRPSKREVIVSMWASGMDSGEISRRVGITRESVTATLSRARKLGDARAACRPLRVHAPRREEIARALATGATAVEVAARLCLAPSTVRAAAFYHRKFLNARPGSSSPGPVAARAGDGGISLPPSPASASLAVVVRHDRNIGDSKP